MYHGRRTEWLDDQYPDSLDLVDRAIQSCPASSCAGTLDIFLLKGSAWPGNAARCAFHRSPAAGASARHRLAIDALSDA